MIASLHCILEQIPEWTKFTHVCLVYLQKNIRKTKPENTYWDTKIYQQTLNDVLRIVHLVKLAFVIFILPQC